MNKISIKTYLDKEHILQGLLPILSPVEGRDVDRVEKGQGQGQGRIVDDPVGIGLGRFDLQKKKSNDFKTSVQLFPVQ